MIDRGWRRSGQYCYKPDLRKSCCPQYTIRLDALQFKVGRSHRKLVHRWNRYVLQGKGEIDSAEIDVKRPKGRQNAHFDLVQSLHSTEHAFLGEAPAKHKFEVTIEPASYTKEKFDLFCKYQTAVHHDTESTVSGFKRFLVTTPLQEEAIPYPAERPSHLPQVYGSHHQLYRIDGKLVAVGVLDILPRCVSSVYFMYDVEWEEFSLGKLSALREVTLAQEIHNAGVPNMGYLYMGFYIQSCQKMRYKGEYSPSYLADPETYDWYPLEKCTPLLNKNRYACFSNPLHSIVGDWSVTETDEGPEPELSKLQGVYILQLGQGSSWIAVPLPASSQWEDSEFRQALSKCIEGLGLDLTEEIIWVPL